jgi:hypothetical protein
MFKKPRLNQQANNIGISADSITLLAFAAAVIFCMYPEVTLATSLEGQLDKIGDIASGKFKTVGLSVATIAAGIWSVIKGNLKLTGLIVAIGITLSIYLSWLGGGMVISA